MFSFIKKKTVGATVTFKIKGMHCPSCAMNIDGELEDVAGVTSATTSYAQSRTKVTYDPLKVTQGTLMKVIESLKYSVSEAEENTKSG